MPVAVPAPEQVTQYLAAHSLEAAIEAAVNDAVLKQVKNPLRHVAEILLKKSEAAGEEGPPLERRKVSLDGPKASASTAAKGKAVFAPVEVSSIKESDSGNAKSGDELTREFKTTDSVNLKPELEGKLKAFFDKMDEDKNGEVTKQEAIAFWGSNFAKVNAQSMFNEVDENGPRRLPAPQTLRLPLRIMAPSFRVQMLMSLLSPPLPSCLMLSAC